MMQLKIKGTPYTYQHYCNPIEVGRRLTHNEMQDFVTVSLIESFEIKGVKCLRHSPDFKSEADFSYQKNGQTVCGVVKYVANRDESEIIIHDLYLNNFERRYPILAEGFHNYNTIPIFFFAEARCLDNEQNIPVAGGRYEITYYPLQMLWNEIPMEGPNISEYEMYKGYADSWCNDDLTFLKNYVSPFFSGYSDLAFDEITSKEGLLRHIEHQHELWRIRHTSIIPKLIKDTDSGKGGILIQSKGKDICFVTLSFSNYRIYHSHTLAPPKNYKSWDKAYELYETHGDHHAPFVLDNELRTFVNEMVKDSKVCLTIDREVNFDNNVTGLTLVASMKYIGDEDTDDIGYLALVAYNPAEDTDEIISCYPYLQGTSVLVEVIDILEWDNQIEATIKCQYSSYDDNFVFHFFATDYYFNKERYKIGAKIHVGIAASSGNVKDASRGFTFEGQKAVDFLARMGQEPSYDANSQIEPVRINTESLVAFIPSDTKCPDMVEFQSPIRKLQYDGYYNNSINRCTIKINQETGLEIPLYFNDISNIKEEDPIMGRLWLTGRLSDPCGSLNNSPTHMVSSLKMAKTAETFLQKLKCYKTRSITDVTSLLNVLTELSIEERQHLCIVKVGNRSRFDFDFFVANFSDIMAISARLDPEGFLFGEDADKYLTDLSKSVVGHSEQAVWQMFLLSIGDLYLPYSNTHSKEFRYILTQEDAERSSKAINGQYSYIHLLPAITSVKFGSGYFSVYVWNSGILYRQVYTFHIHNGKIRFSIDAIYDSSNAFDRNNDRANILFRDGD